MDTTPPPLTTSMDLVRWIGWAQMKAGEDWIRERGLSHAQAFVLGYLAQNPGSIQRDLAEVSRTTAASVSSLLQGLERGGLVERRADASAEGGTSGGTGRSKRVYATPTGVDLIDGFDTAMADANETILAPLSEAERTALHALLSKVTAELPQPTRS
jgi:MarR family transcriptional repressor of mepA